jgi:hypothetical protein
MDRVIAAKKKARPLTTRSASTSASDISVNPFLLGLLAIRLTP